MERLRVKDVKGLIPEVKQKLRVIMACLRNPGSVERLGSSSPHGILLHGPSGCGKTMLVLALANECGVPLVEISFAKIHHSTLPGESARRIRDLLLDTERHAASIVLIKDIDQIVSDRCNLLQLQESMDAPRRGYLVIIGETNKPYDVNPSLKRSGRLSDEIVLKVPDVDAKVEILAALFNDDNIEQDVDLDKIARSARGFVGADLKMLRRSAISFALDRCAYDVGDLSIAKADLEAAAKSITPVYLTQGLSRIPHVLVLEDFDSHTAIKRKLTSIIIELPVSARNNDRHILIHGRHHFMQIRLVEALANQLGFCFIFVRCDAYHLGGKNQPTIRELFNLAGCGRLIGFIANTGVTEGTKYERAIFHELLEELSCGGTNVFVICTTKKLNNLHSLVLKNDRICSGNVIDMEDTDDSGNDWS